MERQVLERKLQKLGVSRANLRGRHIKSLERMYTIMTTDRFKFLPNRRDNLIKALLYFNEDINVLLNMTTKELEDLCNSIVDNSAMHPNQSEDDYLEAVGW